MASTGTDAAVAERLQRIQKTVEEIVRLAEVHPREKLTQDPAPGEWSLMKVLAHTAELLPYWAGQARDVSQRAEDGLPFGRTHEDPARIKAVEDHAGSSLDVMLPMVRDGLAQCVSLLQSIPPRKWQRTGLHARRGEMSVAQFVDSFLVEHLEEHLEQARGVARAGAR